VTAPRKFRRFARYEYRQEDGKVVVFDIDGRPKRYLASGKPDLVELPLPPRKPRKPRLRGASGN
jgi:hypothetical protein